MKKFIMSYSTGKDSALALQKMLASGYECVGMIISFNYDDNTSSTHKLALKDLAILIDAIGIPTKIIKGNNNYQENFRQALRDYEITGGNLICTGDIDMGPHFDWYEKTCEGTNFKPILPLYNENREVLIEEIYSQNIKAIIKVINQKFLDNSLLGQYLNTESVAKFKQNNIDICGENGEYHTVVVDAPFFKKKIKHKTNGNYNLAYVHTINEQKQTYNYGILNLELDYE